MVPSPWNDFTLSLPGQFLHVLNKHGPPEEYVPWFLQGEHTSRRQDINATGFSLYTPETKEKHGGLTTLSALRTLLHMAGRSTKIMTNNFYTALMITTLQMTSS